MFCIEQAKIYGKLKFGSARGFEISGLALWWLNYFGKLK